MYQQIDEIVKKKAVKSVYINPKHSVNMFKYDKNGNRQPIKSNVSTGLRFNNSKEVFAYMFIFIALLFGYTIGHTVPIRDLYYLLIVFLSELGYEEYTRYVNG